MKVVVTGGSGTIGRWCAGALRDAGHEVIAITRAPPFAPDDIQLDLVRDAGAVAAALARLRPEALVHLAWETTHGRFWSAAENDDWVDAGVLLARAFATSGGRRLVVAGTGAEYDWSATAIPDGVCDERRTPVRPSTRYGAAKARLHELLVADAGLIDVQLVWGRVFWLFGPGEAPGRLVPSIAVPLLEGRSASIASGQLVRDFLYARDVGAAFAAAATANVTGPVNVASGRGIRVRDLAVLVAEATGRPELLRIDVGGREGEPPRVVAAVERLREEVGFTPSDDLDVAVREHVEWLRHQVASGA